MGRSKRVSELSQTAGHLIDAALQIKNTEVAKELALPPVKIHCSVLAEDAIKAAIADYRREREQAAASTATQASSKAEATPS